MHKNLLFIFLYLIGVSMAVGETRIAASASYGDVRCAVLGESDPQNTCPDSKGKTFAQAAADGDIVTIPGGVDGKAIWGPDQTITINNAVSIIGQQPSPYPITLASTWGTRISIVSTPFVWNLHQSPHTVQLANINFHYLGGPPLNPSAQPPPAPGSQSTRYDYKVIATLTDGTTRESRIASPGVKDDNTTPPNSYATLSPTTYNRLIWGKVELADHYDVYRTFSGGTPSNTGRIASGLSANTTTLNDTGITATPPVVNGTRYVPVGGEVKPFAFGGVARCWNDTVTSPGNSIPRGGVRIHHIMWTADSAEAEQSSYKWRIVGWITGVMDHCYMNFRVDGTWGLVTHYGQLSTIDTPPESLVTGMPNSPTGNPDPLGSPTGYWGHWSFCGRYIPGANIPTGNGAGPTDVDPRFPSLPNSQKPDTAGDVFYYEDNVFNREGIILDTNNASSRRIFRHNTTTSAVSEHGNDSGQWVSAVGSEEYNNKLEQSDACISGKWHPIQNRGGFKMCFNELWTQFTYPSNFNASAYRLNGNKNGFGPSDGTNFWDQNWNEHLFGTLTRTPRNATGAPPGGYVYTPIPGPSDVDAPTTGTFANVPNDTRIGSVYAKSPATPVNTATGSGYKLRGLTTATGAIANAVGSTDVNKWSGFQIRNVTTSPAAHLGAQSDVNKNITWGFIFTSTVPDVNGDVTITVGGTSAGGTSFFKLGPSDPWEIRYVRKYNRNQGAGSFTIPTNEKQPGTNFPAGVTLLNKNGSTILVAPATPTPAPTCTPGTVCSPNNPTYSDDQTQEYGTWIWNIAERAGWSNNYSATTPIQNQTALSLIQYPFWTGGLHIRDAVSANGGDTDGAPTLARNGTTTGGANSGVVPPATNPPAALATCPAIYKEVTGLPTSPPSPYRRIGADWDGDPNPPYVGVTTAYRGSNRQPDGTGPTQPAASISNLDISSWKVYGPSLTSGAPNAGGPQTYPHPLVSALSAPLFTSPDHLNIIPGTSSGPSPSPTPFLVTASGNPLPTVTLIVGTPQTGVTFTPGPPSDGFGTISWVNPSAASPVSLGFQAVNGESPNASQFPFTLTVSGSPGTAPTITSGASTTFTVGTPGTFAVTATGDAPIALQMSGASLPNWLSFTDNGGGSGTLAGNPTTAVNSPILFDIIANNGVTPTAVQHFTLTINPLFTPTPTPTPSPTPTITPTPTPSPGVTPPSIIQITP